MEETAILEPLKEVATIAAGNSATALSKVIGKPVTMAVPSVKLAAVETLAEAVGPAAQISSAGLVLLDDDLKGLLLFSLDPADADAIAKGAIATQTSGGYKDFDQSVLREMVNIVAGAAVSSLATFLKLELRQSIPASVTDMIGAVLDPFMAQLGESYEKVLLLQDVFTVPAEGISLKLLIIVDPPSTTTLLQKISDTVSGAHGPEH